MKEHLAEAHPEQEEVTDIHQAAMIYEMKVIRKHPTALSRQLHEAIEINRAGQGGVLNNRDEYSQCVIPTLSTNTAKPKNMSTTQPTRIRDTIQEIQITHKRGREAHEDQPEIHHETQQTRSNRPAKRVRLEIKEPEPRTKSKKDTQNQPSTKTETEDPTTNKKNLTVKEMILKMRNKAHTPKIPRTPKPEGKDTYTTTKTPEHTQHNGESIPVEYMPDPEGSTPDRNTPDPVESPPGTQGGCIPAEYTPVPTKDTPEKQENTEESIPTEYTTDLLESTTVPPDSQDTQVECAETPDTQHT